MHLKHALVCRGKMIAAGFEQDEVASGVKTWKKTKLHDFVLCPPEKRDQPLQHEPTDRVLWNEQPVLRDAFQTALDRLVPFDHTDVAACRNGLIECLRPFPLHEHELRIIFSELVAAAKHLLYDEAMQLWKELGPGKVLDMLDDEAQNFSSEVFLPQGYRDEREVKLSEELLCNPETWSCSTFPGEGPCLCVAKDVQVTTDLDCAVCVTYPCASDLWNDTQWREYGCVQLILPPVLEEVEYLWWRSKPTTSLCDGRDGALWFVLKAAICFAGKGGQVCIQAGDDFWSSALAAPFTKHCFTL